MRNIVKALLTQVVYVVIVHRPTGRAFGLDRGYRLTLPLFHLVPGWKATWHGGVGNRFQDGWLPTGKDQRPGWVEGLNEHSFTAYWTYRGDRSPK